MFRIAHVFLLFTFLTLAHVSSVAASPTGSEAYYRWTLSCIDQVEQSIPAMRASAEAAAHSYAVTNSQMSCYGDWSMVGELLFRSGGLYNMYYVPDDRRSILHVGVALFALREKPAEFAKDIASISKLQKLGIVVVVFGSDNLLARMRDANVKAEHCITIPEATQNGLFVHCDNRRVVPTRQVATMITAWTWMGEFAAACTREGKMPIFYKGDAVRGKERMKRYGSLRLHNDLILDPVPAGEAGTAYLASLRASLDTIYRDEMVDIRAAARVLADAYKQQHNVYAFVHGHGIIADTLQEPINVPIFTRINTDWFKQNDKIVLQAGDIVFCNGFDSVFSGKRWDNFAEKARAAGATLIWCITDYRSSGATPEIITAQIDPAGSEANAHTIPADEIFIDQHWALGDAVVQFPGYDIKILPTSGVLSQTILWMLEAETAAQLQLLKDPSRFSPYVPRSKRSIHP